MGYGTPRQRIEAEVARRGRAAFVADCIDLLDGGAADPRLVRVLAGRSADWGLAKAVGDTAYWMRVWAARGLLWAWDDAALPAILRALDDEAWRVREMALKVIARHRLGDALAAAADLRADPVARVRTAAYRAVTMLTASSA